MMIHTNELEIQQSAGTNYRDCFKGTDLRRTEVTIMTWMIQQTSGSAMIGWGTYFMTQVGLSNSNAYSLGVGQYAMAFTGTVASWFLMPHFGRRTLYLWGQGLMFIGLLAIGCLGIPALSPSTGWAIGALMLIETFIYDITVGPVCVSFPFLHGTVTALIHHNIGGYLGSLFGKSVSFVDIQPFLLLEADLLSLTTVAQYSLVAEIPSTRLRIKTVVISRTMYNLAGILIGLLQPRFMNPTSWNWGAKTSLFWAGFNLLGLIWTFFRLPEPKGYVNTARLKANSSQY